MMSSALKTIVRLTGCTLLLAGLIPGALAQDIEHRLSMTMKDAALADVMDMISREERVNIFVSTDTDETVSFSLYDMTVPDAIRAIANAAGFAVEFYGGNYFVVERDEAGKYAPDALTRVRPFALQYTDVEEMQALLEPYLSDYGEITVFVDRRMFFVEDTPEFLDRIERLVSEIDRPPTQILIEAKILEITLTDEDSFGIDWSDIFSSGDGTGTFGTRGLNDPTSDGFFFEFISPDFTAAIDALTSQGRVRTLSTPKLLALQDIESEVIIGDRRGYSVTTTINQVTTESIEFLESGVILRVKATVDENQQVMMAINPEVSTGIINPLNGIPSQTTTEVTTTMIVPDGETVFVGGLIKRSIDESKRGVPGLSRVPLLGRLFSNRKKTATNTETIVLITPTVVTPATPTVDDDAIEQIDILERDREEESRKLNDEMEMFFAPGSIADGQESETAEPVQDEISEIKVAAMPRSGN